MTTKSNFSTKWWKCAVDQKEYFKNKRQIDLRISKQIEREVDEEIERVQKILHNKQNPQLF